VQHALCLISNHENDASPLQLPSVHHNPSCDGYAHTAEERKDNAKKGFWQQNVAKEKLGVIWTFR